MKRIIVEVPALVKYLSQWKDFKLENFKSHVIINKQLPGCGFTEFALTSNLPVVLPSPRNMLLGNKKEQHGDDVYLVVNEYEQDNNIDEDISKPESLRSIEAKSKLFLKRLEESIKNEETTYSRLYGEIRDYMKRMDSENKPYKILVTYDSTYLVKKILKSMGLLDKFYFCVDEFQSILDDSRFKSGVEVEFLSVLQDIPKVLYVSATPMLDKYIELIPEFKDLPYYELDWKTQDPLRIRRPNLKVRTMDSLLSKARNIVNSYLEGKFEKAIVEREGNYVEIESREAVFFVNSVNHIISIIKNTGLTSDRVNILCSNTKPNQDRLWKKLGKKNGFNIGRVPLKGEQHKMFTFCTRTVYLGADFYSTNARSFIFSDSNSDCLSVDVSMDLPQILGRQRLDENPWKNTAEFYYRTTRDWRKMSPSDFQKIVEKKLKKTNNLLRAYNTVDEEAKKDLAEKYLIDTKASKYIRDYVAVNRRSGSSLEPVLNNLVLVSEQRTFDIQQIDYADRFSVFSTLDKEFSSIGAEGSEVNNFFFEYDKLTTYVEKMKCLCTFSQTHPKELVDAVVFNLHESDKIRQHFLALGPDRICSFGYNLTFINRALKIKTFDSEKIDSIILSTFKVGDRKQKKEIKELLALEFQKEGYKGTAKASMILDYFETKLTKVTIDKKAQDGFEILGVKPEYQNLYNLIHKIE